MFYAETKDGKRINAQQSSQGPYVCPGCREPVFLKKGTRKLPHFSHYAHSDCQQFSEGETEHHLMGKQLLMAWLENHMVTVEMEAWLPEIKQRPDLLVHLPSGKKVALEYQCSPIPLTKLQGRTEGYQKNGYDVIWICGMDYEIKERLTQKQASFLQYSETAGFCLTCYDSMTNQLVAYRQLQYNHNNRLTGRKQIYDLAKQTFEKVEDISMGRHVVQPTRLKTALLPVSKQLLLLNRTDSLHRTFLERLYLNGHHIQTLPTWLFAMPTKHLLYQTPSYIWKYNLLMVLTKKKKINTTDLEDFVKNDIQLTVCPFVKKSETLTPLYHFLEELIKRQFITCKRNHSFEITKKFEQTVDLSLKTSLLC